MIGYVCVYRHYRPPEGDVLHARQNAVSHPLLRAFLDRYEGSYFDWGDDPSFFAAEEILHDVRRASWGVCRADVRGALAKGDFVVFFSGRESDDGESWDYYWAGVGTVGRLVQDRRAIWTDATLKPYRRFLNVLVKREGSHREYFPDHPDWERRINSPYILFDPALSRFDLEDPVHVSTYRPSSGLFDQWSGKSDETVGTLELLLFGNRDRRLRTSHTGFGHAKVRLSGTDEELVEVRSKLIQLFDSKTPPRLPRALATAKSVAGRGPHRRGCR